MSSINEASVEKKLKAVTNTQDSIQGLSLWILHHKAHHKKIVELWFKVMKKEAKPAQRLVLLYLCNDVVQNCKKKQATVYIKSFKHFLKDAIPLVRDPAIRANAERILKIWEQRSVFPSDYVGELRELLLNVKARPPANSKLLVEFEPRIVVEKLLQFKTTEQAVQMNMQQMYTLGLDVSTNEVIKHLKDRSHGREISQNFDDSVKQLSDFCTGLEAEVKDRRALIELLEQSQDFYDTQYGEAKIVANAYKIFGSKLNNMKRKIDELCAELPNLLSPVPSPSMDAPSPGDTPPSDRISPGLTNMPEQEYEPFSLAAADAAADVMTPEPEVMSPIIPLDPTEGDGTDSENVHVEAVAEEHMSTDDEHELLETLAEQSSVSVGSAPGETSPPVIPVYIPSSKSSISAKESLSKSGVGDALEQRIADMLPSLPLGSPSMPPTSGAETQGYNPQQWKDSKGSGTRVTHYTPDIDESARVLGRLNHPVAPTAAMDMSYNPGVKASPRKANVMSPLSKDDSEVDEGGATPVMDENIGRQSDDESTPAPAEDKLELEKQLSPSPTKQSPLSSASSSSPPTAPSAPMSSFQDMFEMGGHKGASPIDFLTNLISQTNNSPTSSFFQKMGVLASTVQTHVSQQHRETQSPDITLENESRETDDDNDIPFGPALPPSHSRNSQHTILSHITGEISGSPQDEEDLPSQESDDVTEPEPPKTWSAWKAKQEQLQQREQQKYCVEEARSPTLEPLMEHQSLSLTTGDRSPDYHPCTHTVFEDPGHQMPLLHDSSLPPPNLHARVLSNDGSLPAPDLPPGMLSTTLPPPDIHPRILQTTQPPPDLHPRMLLTTLPPLDLHPSRLQTTLPPPDLHPRILETPQEASPPVLPGDLPPSFPLPGIDLMMMQPPSLPPGFSSDPPQGMLSPPPPIQQHHMEPMSLTLPPPASPQSPQWNNEPLHNPQWERSTNSAGAPHAVAIDRPWPGTGQHIPPSPATAPRKGILKGVSKSVLREIPLHSEEQPSSPPRSSQPYNPPDTDQVIADQQEEFIAKLRRKTSLSSSSSVSPIAVLGGVGSGGGSSGSSVAPAPVVRSNSSTLIPLTDNTAEEIHETEDMDIDNANEDSGQHLAITTIGHQQPLPLPPPLPPPGIKHHGYRSYSRSNEDFPVDINIGDGRDWEGSSYNGGRAGYHRDYHGQHLDNYNYYSNNNMYRPRASFMRPSPMKQPPRSRDPNHRPYFPRPFY